jgi:CBS domain-containing membrane protein
MTTVADLMTEIVETLAPGDTLADAERLMRLSGVRHLPVVDSDERLIGLVSHQTILSAWVSHGRPERERPGAVAAEIPIEMMMEKDVLTANPEMPAAEAARILEIRRIGCLPVIDRDKLIGIITEGDFLRFARRHFDIEDARAAAWQESFTPH